MPTTYILGHKKPDTDAVVAPMALEFLFKQQDCFGYTNPMAAITEELNPETRFLLEKFGVTPPRIISAADLAEGDTVVLVDHNEADQRMDGLDESLIVEIVDHHKAKLNLSQPVFMTFKAWGASSTIVYWMMKQCAVVPDKLIASLMLAAILSDTVGFKSATTTQTDKDFGMELATIAEVTDIDAFTLEIFKAKSNISSLTIEQIVKNDYKVFDFGTKTMIDQLETVEQDILVVERKAELLAAMQTVKSEMQVPLLFVAITDILKVNTKLLIMGEDEAVVATRAFGGTVTDNILDIGPKMSRKKEIAPAIEKALA